METFTRLAPQHLVSSVGYEVLSAGRFGVIYREDGKDMLVEIEYGVQAQPSLPYSTTLMPGAFAKWNDGTPVDRENQLRIENNFRAAMEFHGFAVVVWDDANQSYQSHTI